jgi:hypothetical protein
VGGVLNLLPLCAQVAHAGDPHLRHEALPREAEAEAWQHWGDAREDEDERGGAGAGEAEQGGGLADGAAAGGGGEGGGRAGGDAESSLPSTSEGSESLSDAASNGSNLQEQELRCRSGRAHGARLPPAAASSLHAAFWPFAPFSRK